MPRLSNEEFVTRLTSLYESSSSSGSVYLSSKRASHPDVLKDAQGDVSMTSGEERYPIIYRATDGKDDKNKKVSISTIVSPSSLQTFQDLLQPAIRTSASLYLRKRDKAKERKADKVLAVRRKKDEELGGWKGVAKQGSKRGAGHRQQQRAKRRALKLRKEEAVARKKAAAMSTTTTATATATTASNSVDNNIATSQQQQQQQQQQSGGGTGSSNKKKKKKGGKK
ncbi:unnamed protein product [Sympodiomycopsis kandeliae]